MRQLLNRLKMSAPNICSFANLGFGFAAGIAVINGRFDIAPWFIIVAMIFDAYDGKLARHFNAISKMGTELDSLCDVATFGVAPALLIGGIVSLQYPIAGWTLGFLFLTAAVYRLARFNVMQADGSDHREYTGLATTGAGGMVAALIILNTYLVDNFEVSKIVDWLPIITVILSALMVSKIRFPNTMDFADRQFKTPLHASILSGAVILFAWLPQVVPSLIFSGYIMAGFLGILKRRMHFRAAHKF
ncbi:MAG: CDP-diacylglycerol--serine O-phosphatidyltransferase [Candidatus Brocadiales bacterium]